MNTTLLAIACLGSLSLTLLGIYKDWLWLRAPTKTLASLLFIAHGWAAGAWSQGPAGQAVMVALVLGALGDVLLISRDRRAFLAGLVAFLSAHVAYVVAFALLGMSVNGTVVVLPILALAWVIWRWIGTKAGKMAKPVAAYIAVISLMVVAAFAALAADPTAGRAILVLGAVMFFVSDICVARDRFVQQGFVNRVIGLPLYYSAQLVFGAAIAMV